MREFKALSDRCKDAKDWLDYRAALVCVVVANSNPFRDSKAKTFTIEDFMPGKKRDVQTPKQMLATMEMYCAAYGDKITKVIP